MNKYRVDYYEYIKSDRWKEKRQEVIDFYGGKCVLCNTARQPLNVHHRTYERLGNERLADLILLCEDCHTKHHDKLAEPPIVRPVKKTQKEDLPANELPLPLRDGGRLLDARKASKTIEINASSVGDKARDTLRCRRLSGMISTYPGEDLIVIRLDKRHRYEQRAWACDELIDRLTFLVGKENISVKETERQ